MPQRDGQPTEDEIAAQRRGEGPAAIVPGVVAPAAAAAAALAATTAAAAAVTAAPLAIAPILTIGAISTAAAGIIGAFDRFLTDRRTDQEDYVNGILEAEIPDLPEDARLEVVDNELEAERAFAAKARARLDVDLPKALSIRDTALREAEVQKILDRERRYLELRENAVAVRALGEAEKRVVKAKSPAGAYWRVSPHVQQHTLDCLAMGGKVWPWSVLETYHPPLHVGCSCELMEIDRAVADGLVGPDDYQTGDQALYAMSIVEADVDTDELAEEMALLEAAWDRHWGKGTTKAGQFRPQRGGDPGAVLRRHRGARMHLPAMHEPTPVARLDAALDVRDLKVSDLRAGDRVMVNGNLEHVTDVHAKTPGLLTLEHSGLVHVDRDTIRGVPADRPTEPAGPTPTDPPPAPIGAGPTHDDVLKVARMRRPAEGGELLAGFHFNSDLSRSEARGEDLHLPPGFFKQSRAVREKVLFRHLGGRLADSLGSAGLKSLGEQDPHLSGRKAIVDAYHALNSDARGRMSDVHPDAMRLVATAAHERGLPLHPDAARLARRPAAVDAPAAEHPAHGLAKRAEGLSVTESRDLLGAAGYHYGGSDTGPNGGPSIAMHNHDANATITLHHNAEGYKVVGADVHVHPPVSEAEHGTLVGLDSRQAIDRMAADGFAPNYTSAGDWLRFIHPDGRGRALKLNDTGPKMEVTHVAAFTPTAKDAADAHGVLLRNDPLAHIKPGDTFEPIRTALERGAGADWRIADTGNTPDLKLADGATSFAEFRSRRDPSERLVMHLRYEGGKPVTVVAVGHGSVDPAKRGQIVTAAERETDARVAAEAQQREDDARRHAAASAGETIHNAVRSGDTAALKAVLDGHGPNDAVTLLRQHGFDLRDRRRSRRGGDRRITYTLRAPGGETVKVSGPHTYGNHALDKVEIKANPQGGKRDRLPAGQAPRNLNELLVDALGRADELGARYDAGVHVTAIIKGGVQSGAAAHHEFNGAIAIRQSGEAKRITDYLKRRQAGERLLDSDHLSFYNDLETIQHEINHGVAKRGQEQGGLSFGPKHYRGLGKNVEEALTEETGHLLAVDWLRSHGMTDVLAAVKRNPEDARVLGVYRDYRVQLKRVLDDANVPASERPALLERMKFQMTPEEREAEIVRLSGHDNIVQAFHADPRRRSEMKRNFEPVVRPDLSDIDAEPEAITPAGRKLTLGATVMADNLDGGRSPGEVVGIRPGFVKVRYEDGMELWISDNRVE